MKRIVLIPVVAVGLMITLAVGSYALAGGSGDTGKSFVKADDMTGYQEDASVSSTGIGHFSARIEDDAISYTLSYSDLEGGTVLFAHIHFSKRDANGGVAAFLCGGGTKPPCPQSGTVEGVITPTDVVGPATQGIEPGSFAELVAAIRTGNAYANLHTTRWPGGEIRGQINDQNQRETTQG
jgi:hypothetical protein